MTQSTFHFFSLPSAFQLAARSNLIFILIDPASNFLGTTCSFNAAIILRIPCDFSGLLRLCELRQKVIAKV